MNLVGYSDSEDSDHEPTPAPAPAPRSTMTTKPAAKPSFQKVVDRSNPHKIKVALPTVSAPVDDFEADAPPAKKARTGGGAFSGFNSLLPAPKKTGAAGSGAKKGLGRGVSLRTGAAPAFSREPVEPEEYTAEQPQTQDDIVENGKHSDGLSKTTEELPVKKEEKEVKIVGKATMFKPLSVARNTKKKKKPVTAPIAEAPKQAAASIAPAEVPKAPSKLKVSLFSIATEETSTVPMELTGQYKSFLEPTEEIEDTANADGQLDQYEEQYTTQSSYHQPTTTSTTSGPQSLDSIAADLNLSASAKRQLLGRHAAKGRNVDLSAINVVNFNTDEEYAANEELRKKGEQVQHNPVRAIAPGKHSLQQLVNAVHTQKDALEEHFATGARNRKEAGSKYGW